MSSREVIGIGRVSDDAAKKRGLHVPDLVFHDTLLCSRHGPQSITSSSLALFFSFAPCQLVPSSGRRTPARGNGPAGPLEARAFRRLRANSAPCAKAGSKLRERHRSVAQPG